MRRILFGLCLLSLPFCCFGHEVHWVVAESPSYTLRWVEEAETEKGHFERCNSSKCVKLSVQSISRSDLPKVLSFYQTNLNRVAFSISPPNPIMIGLAAAFYYALQFPSLLFVGESKLLPWCLVATSLIAATITEKRRVRIIQSKAIAIVGASNGDIVTALNPRAPVKLEEAPFSRLVWWLRQSLYTYDKQDSSNSNFPFKDFSDFR